MRLLKIISAEIKRKQLYCRRCINFMAVM